MIAQKHSIKRQVIELTVRDPEQAKALQAEVSRVYRQRIIPLLDRCFTEMGNPDTLYRIDTLELDLGLLDSTQLEKDLVQRVDSVLRRELEKQIDAQERVISSPSEHPRARSQLELFAFFVQTGRLPWWADTSGSQLLAENVEQLLHETPDLLRATFRKLLLEARSRQRIVNQYSDDQLTKLAALLVPAYMPSIVRDFPVLIEMLRETPVISGQQPSRIRQILWNILLQVSSLGGQQHSSLSEFYEAVLARVAVELGTSRRIMVTQMHQALQRDEITQDLHTATITPDLLRVLEAETKAKDVSREEKSKPGQLSETGQQKSTAAHATVKPVSKDERYGSLEKAPPDVNFSDSEEIYVDNAGLVILSPFLEHLFGRLDLLENRQFKTSAAQQRSVGLLQVIVTGEPSSPEYLMPLNKLLCGLQVTEVFDFGMPLLDSEMEECEGLLQAAIAQAPILHDMALEGFRGTFLLRRGMISAQDGFPLLRVERETYDIVLDRFPWTWEWVKLPWMKAPLRVEW